MLLNSKVRSLLKILAPVTVSVCGLFLLKLVDPRFISAETLSAWLRPIGPYGPLVFIAFLAIRPVTLLSGQLLTAVGGVLFGTWGASAYSLMGSVLATGLIFALSRRFGARWVKKWAGGREAVFRRVVEQHGFKCALGVSINPLLPTDLFIATMAASGARFWPTALGVVAGSVPGTLLTALFGSSIGRGQEIMTFASLAGLVVSLGLGVWVGRKVSRDFRLESPAPLPSMPNMGSAEVAVG